VPAEDAGGATIGYRVELARGTLPDRLSLPEHPVAAPGGFLVFSWNDNAVFQRSVDFDLRVVPIDRHGREGEPADPFGVHDGWHVAWLVKVLAAAGALLAVVLTLRKRRAEGRIRPRGAV
jgi:hypothetical protein